MKKFIYSLAGVLRVRKIQEEQEGWADWPIFKNWISKFCEWEAKKGTGPLLRGQSHF